VVRYDEKELRTHGNFEVKEFRRIERQSKSFGITEYLLVAGDDFRSTEFSRY